MYFVYACSLRQAYVRSALGVGEACPPPVPIQPPPITQRPPIEVSTSKHHQVIQEDHVQLHS